MEHEKPALDGFCTVELRAFRRELPLERFARNPPIFFLRDVLRGLFADAASSVSNAPS